jgi:hypothetical protein
MIGIRGRKRKLESRSAEFRHMLIAWKQAPESARASVRGLAREIGTSHQLLEHYLKGLEEWQYKERFRQALPSLGGFKEYNRDQPLREFENGLRRGVLGFTAVLRTWAIQITKEQYMVVAE